MDYLQQILNTWLLFSEGVDYNFQTSFAEGVRIISHSFYLSHGIKFIFLSLFCVNKLTLSVSFCVTISLFIQQTIAYSAAQSLSLSLSLSLSHSLSDNLRRPLYHLPFQLPNISFCLSLSLEHTHMFYASLTHPHYRWHTQTLESHFLAFGRFVILLKRESSDLSQC